ncbi:MAG: hypothetical protein QOI41_1812 [Myxococcales bacterium]|nr:hypothetical protein [Myxococcales bacterium]
MWGVPRAPLLLTFGLAVGAAGLFGSTGADARGWEEVHQTSDDVRVTVGADGIAVVQHHLRYRVVAGHFKTLDFTGVEPTAELVAETTALAEKGGELPAHVTPNPKTPGAVKIAFDEPRGIGRGVYVLDVSYRLDLVAAKMLVRDGAMWRLAWTAPPSPEGHDGARVVFELPSAPTEPRLASPEQAATTLATLRREPDKDELELVRAHIPRGEAVTWSARVDPKAFPRVTSPELRPPAAAVAASVPVPNHVPLVLIACALAAIAGAFATALGMKQGFVARACAAASVRARPLLPLRWGLGPFVYGAAATGALAALLWGTPAYGAALVVLAMLLGTHRSPAPIARPRGPGRWQPIADSEVLVARPRAAMPGDALDIGTRAGKLTSLAVVMALATVAFVLRTRLAGAAIAIPLVSAALVPLFVTGTRAQLPRGPAELAALVLGPARDALARLVDLAHVDVRCVARFREGTTSYDEVRLSCAPADRIPGLRSIELALATLEPAAHAALPEVLVRFDDASEAASKIAQLAPGIRVVTGRGPDEKVLRLAPRVPTPAGAARLLARLASDLEGRRASDRAASIAGIAGIAGIAVAPASIAPASASRGFNGADRRVTRTRVAAAVAPLTLRGASAST